MLPLMLGHVTSFIPTQTFSAFNYMELRFSPDLCVWSLQIICSESLKLWIRSFWIFVFGAHKPRDVDYSISILWLPLAHPCDPPHTNKGSKSISLYLQLLGSSSHLALDTENQRGSQLNYMILVDVFFSSRT